jgi:hypothetical protein
MKYNALLSEFTLVFDRLEDLFKDSDDRSKTAKEWSLVGLLTKRTDPDTRNMNLPFITDSLELYIQRMIGACARRVCIPAHSRSMWAAPHRLKSLLSPSNRKRIRFIDHRQALWADIEEYFRPVVADVPRQERMPSEPEHGKPALGWFLEESVWDLYLLALATRNQCEVPLSPTQAIQRIDTLIGSDPLSPESRSRLAIVRGLFSLFGDVQEVPCFRYIATEPHQSLIERLDEILDDAYLLEASCLPRFLGLKANVKAIKRDLRKLVQFIVKNRSWARGVLAAASQTAVLPTVPGETAEKLFDTLPSLRGNYFAPVLVDPRAHLMTTRAKTLVSYRRVPFSFKENGVIMISPVGQLKVELHRRLMRIKADG